MNEVSCGVLYAPIPCIYLSFIVRESERLFDGKKSSFDVHKTFLKLEKINFFSLVFNESIKNEHKNAAKLIR